MWPFRSVPKANPLRGRQGEKLACRFLKRHGCRILATNYRCPVGEADMIALEKTSSAILFVEVKTRRRDDNVAPESAVNADKQRRLRRIAKYYLAHHDTADRPVRFDVVSIVLPDVGEPTIRHIPDAF